MLSKFERCKLTFGPTPIETLPRLTEHLGGGVELYAKREDRNPGLVFGGNKLRKLEYIVPYAIPAGASVHKLGGLGYVGFAEEMRRQEAEMGFRFD